MDPIGNINHLAEILRKQLAETRRESSTSTRPGLERSTPSGRPPISEVQRRVREKMQQIDANDPHVEQKSVHLFLESVLLWEFGEQLMEDPKFYALLDEVQQSMESDPTLRKDLAALVASFR